MRTRIAQALRNLADRLDHQDEELFVRMLLEPLTTGNMMAGYTTTIVYRRPLEPPHLRHQRLRRDNPLHRIPLLLDFEKYPSRP